MTSTASFLHTFRSFAKNPCVDGAKAVSECLSEDSVRQMSFMGQEDFVLTSLLTTVAELNVRNKNEIITHIVEAATKFISHSRIKKLVSLQTTLMILLKQVGVGPDYISIQPNLSEEFKLAVINCIAVSFRRAVSDVLEQFYTKDNLSLIAQILSISQCIIANETYRPLRIAGIECTLSAQQLHDEADESDIVLRQQIADMVFILLPKVISTITNVATGDETLGQTLIVHSIVALGRVLCLVFEDGNEVSSRSIVEQTKILIENSLKNISKSPENLDVLKLPKKSTSVEENLKQIYSKQRTSDWLAAASLKIQIIIQKLHKLTGSKSNEIRQKLYQFSELLLRRCQTNLASCIPALLEINLTLYDDAAQRSEFVFNETIIDMIEKLFVDHLFRLVRVAHTGDEDEQIANIHLLRGFVFMLGQADRLKITLSNESTLDKFIAGLLCFVELERPMKLLEENNNIYDLSEKKLESVQSLVQLRDNTPWKIYKNLRNVKLIKEIASIFRCLSSQYPVNIFILEYLLNLLATNSINCNETLIIIQLIAGGNNPSESIHVEILEELLRDFRWNLATELIEQISTENPNRTWFEDRVDGLYESAITILMSDIKDTGTERATNDVITIRDIKNNILHMCLTIETVGLYAKHLGQQYQVFMLKSFHRLLEKSASIHYMIRVAALLALNNVKEAFSLNSVTELIFNNADYVAHSINISLKKSDQIDVALRMLSIVLHYSSVESMPHLENIIETIVTESAKSNQTANVLSFMRAFGLILSVIRDSVVKEPESLASEATASENGTNYADTWKSILKDTEIVEDDTSVDQEEMGNAEEPAQAEEEKVEKPLLVQLSINIIKRSIPYFASKNQEIKLSALDCLTVGLDIIKDYEDDLLPIVHLMWNPFLNQCIRDSSPVVLRYCIRLLAKLASYAKDFIHKRSADQLLPHINSQMHALSKKCIAEKHQFLYEHTQEFKLIQELMTNLPDILICLNVQEKEFDDALNACIWLLDKNQPQSLQIHCVDLLKKCTTFDICSVYVKLLKYHQNECYKINCKKVFPSQF